MKKLGGLFMGSVQSEVRELAENIMNKSTETGFWYSAPIDVLSALILKIKADKEGSVTTEEIIKEIETAKSESNYFIEQYQKMSESHIAYKYFHEINTMQSETKESILSTIENNLR